MNDGISSASVEQAGLSRKSWRTKRQAREAYYRQTGRYGGKPRWYWYLHKLALHVVWRILQVTGLSVRGKRNALDLQLTQVPIPDNPNRPSPVLRILHLSDLHLDALPEIEQRLLQVVAGQAVDLCVWTGDYCDDPSTPPEQTAAAVGRLVASIPARYGHFGVLGNHDSVELAVLLESSGLTMLLQEQHAFNHLDQSIQLLGVDDPHFFMEDEAHHLLKLANPEKSFTILLAHSPELFSEAARAGIDLYLCGHTHGGQICLPGGRPILTNLRCGKAFSIGLWHYEQMTGYTNRGVGTSALPVRFHSTPEAALLDVHVTSAKTSSR